MGAAAAQKAGFFGIPTCDRLAPQPLVQLTPKLVGLVLIIYSSDAALPFLDIFGGSGDH